MKMTTSLQLMTGVFLTNGFLVGCVSSSAQTDGANNKTIGPLFQIILNVRDMATQVEFYNEVLGLELVYPDTLTDVRKETFVRLRTGGADLALHAGRTTPNARQEPRLSFMTEDIHTTREILLKQGLELGPIRSPAPGVLVIDTRDPEGNTLHLEARVPVSSSKWSNE